MGEKMIKKGCLSGDSESVLSQLTFKELFEIYEFGISWMYVNSH